LALPGSRARRASRQTWLESAASAFGEHKHEGAIMTEKSFVPTLRLAAAARRGLRLREKFDRGGTQVGVDRAHQLAERRPLSEADVKSMHSFFARHAVDKTTKTHAWNSDSDPSAGFIAWLLWGGDAGKDWADRKRKQIER
jgi:hypothetical protein